MIIFKTIWLAYLIFLINYFNTLFKRMMGNVNFKLINSCFERRKVLEFNSLLSETI